MKDVVGIVSCDVVDSTSLDRAGILQLREDIYSDLFTDLSKIDSTLWGRVVRGDTIECCIDNAQRSFRIALLIKCWLMNWATLNSTSAYMKEYGMRYSIGIGSMRIVDRENDIMDGIAVYIAGRNLDYISERNIPVAFGMHTNLLDIESLIKNNLLLLDGYFRNLTSRQCAVLYHKMLGLPEVEISRILHISQAAVNLRSRNAGWRQIKDTLVALESINYEDYVL